MNTQDVALACEFFTLAQLALRGYIGTLTLGHTKQVDILVSNPKTRKMFRVEVKTASKGPYKMKMFGENYEWIMDEKHEGISDPDLYYCFVFLRSPNELPKFFIVPSEEVAKYCKREYDYWVKLPRKKEVKKTPMRTFRIGLNKESHGLSIEKYENRWDFFDK